MRTSHYVKFLPGIQTIQAVESREMCNAHCASIRLLQVSSCNKRPHIVRHTVRGLLNYKLKFMMEL